MTGPSTERRAGGWGKAAALLICVNILATLPGAAEYAYQQRPTLLSTLASVGMVVAWGAVAFWAGVRQVRGFAWFATAFWTLMLLVLFLAVIAARTDDVFPGFQVLLVLVFLAGGPVHGLTPLIPAGSLHASYAIACLGTLLVSIATYALGRRKANAHPRRSPG